MHFQITKKVKVLGLFNLCGLCALPVFQAGGEQKSSELLLFSTSEQTNRLPVERNTPTVGTDIYSAVVLKEGRLEAMIKYLSCFNGM